MKIIFLITTKGHGKGGHFHSLNTIANKIGENHQVDILNVGVKVSESLNGENFNINFVKYNGYNFLQVYFKLKKLVKSIQPDIVHAFDVESFAFSRLLSKHIKKPSYLNKCGGPNPKIYYPKADNFVLFSLENKTFFDENSKYNKVTKTLIPNRVKTVSIDQNRVNKFNDTHRDSNSVRFLRIARLGNHYHQSILQSINLVEWLLKEGEDVELIIVGTIQNVEVFNHINSYIEERNLSQNVILETSDEFTKTASEILDIGDVIIGTGRNFMEAASLNKILLVPYKDQDYPLLVSKENFEQVFKTNFSPRTQVNDYNTENNLRAIKNVISNIKLGNVNSKDWFDDYFNVNGANSKYIELYNTSSTRNSFIFDTLLNILYSIRAFATK